MMRALATKAIKATKGQGNGGLISLMSLMSLMSQQSIAMNLLDLARSALQGRDAEDGRRYRWRVTLPDDTSFEVCCSPETTATEMGVLYAGARVAPLPDAP